MIVVYELKVLKMIRPITHGNEELHAKFPAFRRLDSELFTDRLTYYCWLWIFTPRFSLVVFGMVMMMLGLQVLTLGIDPKKIEIGSLRYKLI